MDLPETAWEPQGSMGHILASATLNQFDNLLTSEKSQLDISFTLTSQDHV